MVPLDSPHVWDAHWRAWEVIHFRGTPLLPTGYTKATRGGSTATPNDPPNTATRPPRCAPRLPRGALGSLSMPHMRGARVGGHRDSYGGVVGMYKQKRPKMTIHVHLPFRTSQRLRLLPSRERRNGRSMWGGRNRGSNRPIAPHLTFPFSPGGLSVPFPSQTGRPGPGGSSWRYSFGGSPH